MKVVIMMWILLLNQPLWSAVNGESCKQALNPLVALRSEIQQNHFLAQDVYGAIPNALGVPMYQFMQDSKTVSQAATGYISKVRWAMSSCRQWCEGLILKFERSSFEFRCDQYFSRRSLLDIEGDIALINPKATTHPPESNRIQDQLDAEFVNPVDQARDPQDPLSTGLNREDIVEVSKPESSEETSVEDERPATLPVPAYKNHYIHRADAYSEPLIEL